MKLIDIIKAEKEYAHKVFEEAFIDQASGSALALSNAAENSTFDIKVRSKNLIPYPYYKPDGEYTSNGMTIVINGEGDISVSGTPTGIIQVTLYEGEPLVKSGTCVLSDGRGAVNAAIFLELYTVDDTYITALSTANGDCIYNAEDYPTVGKWYIRAKRRANGVEASGTIKPMLNVGTTAMPFAPYVSDLSAVGVKKYGKNLIPYPYHSSSYSQNGLTYTDNGDGSITVNGTATASAMFFITGNQASRLFLKAGTYTLSGNPAAFQLILYAYENTSSNTAIASFPTTNSTPKTFTLTQDAYCLVYISSKTGLEVNNVVVKPQLELNSVATEYEKPIEPTTYAVSADGTVEDVTPIYPNTTLLTDTAGAVIDCTYTLNNNIVKIIEAHSVQKDEAGSIIDNHLLNSSLVAFGGNGIKIGQEKLDEKILKSIKPLPAQVEKNKNDINILKAAAEGALFTEQTYITPVMATSLNDVDYWQSIVEEIPAAGGIAYVSSIGGMDPISDTQYFSSDTAPHSLSLVYLDAPDGNIVTETIYTFSEETRSILADFSTSLHYYDSEMQIEIKRHNYIDVINKKYYINTKYAALTGDEEDLIYYEEDNITVFPSIKLASEDANSYLYYSSGIMPTPFLSYINGDLVFGVQASPDELREACANDYGAKIIYCCRPEVIDLSNYLSDIAIDVAYKYGFGLVAYDYNGNHLNLPTSSVFTYYQKITS